MATEDTIRAIRLAHVVILVIDAHMVLEKQDLQIADHVINEGRALILAVNKWDDITEKKETLENLKYKIDTGMAQIKNPPSVTISALKNRNLGLLMQKVIDVYELWQKRVATGPLNKWLSDRESQNPAPLVSGRRNRLKYIAQINTRPPTFALWISQPKEFPASYKRYLLNALREDFDMEGLPLRLLVRTSKNPYK